MLNLLKQNDFSTVNASPYFTCNVPLVSSNQYPQPWQAECQQQTQRQNYTAGWDDSKIGNY